MIDNTENNDDLTVLGNRRARHVKDWLFEQGEVGDARVFILTPNVVEIKMQKVGSEGQSGRSLNPIFMGTHSLMARNTIAYQK